MDGITLDEAGGAVPWRRVHPRLATGRRIAVLLGLAPVLLGAVAEGDIGSHFPPSDPQWRGAESGQFLQHAASLVRVEGGVIDFVDLTLICEAPKIGPHRAAMRTRIGALLGLSEDRVSIKATTTERLGFTGRREGIAALATATLIGG